MKLFLLSFGAGLLSTALAIGLVVLLGSGGGGAELAQGLARLGLPLGGGMLAGLWLLAGLAAGVAAWVATRDVRQKAAASAASLPSELREANTTILQLSQRLAERDAELARLRGQVAAPGARPET